MIINDTGARTKLCCGPEGCGRTTDQGRLCAGSDCMAWLPAATVYLDAKGNQFRQQVLDGSLTPVELGTCSFVAGAEQPE